MEEHQHFKLRSRTFGIALEARLDMFIVEVPRKGTGAFRGDGEWAQETVCIKLSWDVLGRGGVPHG